MALIFLLFYCFPLFWTFWLTTFRPSMCHLGPITTLLPEAKLTKTSVLIKVKNKWVCNLPLCPEGPVCLLSRTINVTSLAGSTIQTWKTYILISESKRNIQLWMERSSECRTVMYVVLISTYATVHNISVCFSWCHCHLMSWSMVHNGDMSSNVFENFTTCGRRQDSTAEIRALCTGKARWIKWWSRGKWICEERL